jgi:hypothetical protein
MYLYKTSCIFADPEVISNDTKEKDIRNITNTTLLYEDG